MAYDPDYVPIDDEFERASTGRFVGNGFIAVGSLFTLFTAAFAVAHYGYGAQMHDEYSGRPAGEVEVALTLLLFGTAGALAVWAGICMRRRARGESGEAEKPI